MSKHQALVVDAGQPMEEVFGAVDRLRDDSRGRVRRAGFLKQCHRIDPRQTDVNVSDGTLTTASYALRSADLSTPTSAPRWSKVTADWAGRKIKEERPAPPSASPSTFTKQYYYNSSAQLVKTTETGLADFLYEYDAQGELRYSGLDINADGDLDLAGMDRITETRSQVYESSSVWYLRNLTYVYNRDNNSTALLQSDTRQRLVPYLGNSTDFDNRKVQAEARSYDAFGNETVQTTLVDPATRLATVTTNLPDSSIDAVTTTLNGRTVAQRSGQNLTSYTHYDALGRVVKQTDPRTDATSTARIGYYTSGTGAIGQVAWRQDGAGNQTDYAYESATGRLATETNALAQVARYSYTTRGELYRTWGDTGYPVEYGYDDYGQKVTMKTFQNGSDWDGVTWPASPGTADTTIWDFDEASGTLTSKTDAANEAVGYTYYTRGQIKRRTWARGVTTDYTYSGTTAELTEVDYSDSTTDLAYTYNRLGQIKTVLDATSANGTDFRTFNYSSTTTQLTQEDLSSFLGTRSVAYQYDNNSGTKGRLVALGMGPTSTPTTEYSVSYDYDGYGRLDEVGGRVYTYAANSNLIASISDIGSAWTQTRTYEANRNLLAAIETKWSANSKAKFAYTNDQIGRRTVVAKTGEMFSRYSNGGIDTHYGYNDRSEVTSEVTKLGGTSTVLTGREDAYAFDNIGNRTSTTHNSDAATYTANSLNQYTVRQVNGSVDVTGLTAAAATVTIDASTSGITRHNDWYYKKVTVTNDPTAAWQTVDASSSAGGGIVSRQAFVPRTPEAFTYDEDGNLTSDGKWDYTYDAENRLVSMQTHASVTAFPIANADARRLEFKNDYLGRRVQKVVRNGWDGSIFTTVLTEEKFVYDGWNLIANLNASSLSVTASYYWGLDWSGSLQGAGGVGGLLSVVDLTGSPVYHLPSYDGNGNLMGLVNRASGVTTAEYEYDAFGQTLRASGSYAATNPFRFSTKYTDGETNLVYYGLRYYSPSLGRFVTRDMIEEKGGINLHAFCRNNGINHVDILGMWPMPLLAAPSMVVSDRKTSPDASVSITTPPFYMEVRGLKPAFVGREDNLVWIRSGYNISGGLSIKALQTNLVSFDVIRDVLEINAPAKNQEIVRADRVEYDLQNFSVFNEVSAAASFKYATSSAEAALKWDLNTFEFSANFQANIVDFPLPRIGDVKGTTGLIFSYGGPDVDGGSIGSGNATINDGGGSSAGLSSFRGGADLTPAGNLTSLAGLTTSTPGLVGIIINSDGSITVVMEDTKGKGPVDGGGAPPPPPPMFADGTAER